jgi:hypothetical protein
MAWIYRLRYDTSPNFTNPSMHDWLDEPVFTVTGLTIGATYYVQVAARRAPDGQWSEWSSTVSVSQPPLPLADIDTNLVLDIDAQVGSIITAGLEPDAFVLDADADTAVRLRTVVDTDIVFTADGAAYSPAHRVWTNPAAESDVSDTVQLIIQSRDPRLVAVRYRVGETVIGIATKE